MRWNKADLLQAESLNVSFDENVEIDSAEFAGTTLLNGAKNVHVKGKGFLDPQTDRFYAEMKVKGVMLCPDAITGKEVEYPFETEASETYAFEETEDEEEDLRIVKDGVIDLMPAVVDAILLEAPVSFTTADPEDYPSGDGWRIMTEEDYEQDRRENGDPRLAALRNYKTE